MNDQEQAIAAVLEGFTSMPSNGAVEHALREHVEHELMGALHAVTVEVMPGLLVRPDDVLVLQSSNYITTEHAALVKAELFKRMPLLRDVVILQHGMHVAGVYRESDT